MKTVFRSTPFKLILAIFTALCLFFGAISTTAFVLLELSGGYDGVDPGKELLDDHVQSYAMDTLENYVYHLDVYRLESDPTDPNFVYVIEDLLHEEATDPGLSLEGATNLQTVYWIRAIDSDGVIREEYYYGDGRFVSVSDAVEAYRITGGYRYEVPRGNLYETDRWTQFFMQIRNALPILAPLLLLFFLLGMGLLCHVAGRKPNVEDVALSKMNRIPMDLLLLFLGAAGLGSIWILDGLGRESTVRLFLISAGVLGSLACIAFVWLVYTLAAQIKGKTLLRDCVLSRLFRWLIRGLKGCFVQVAKFLKRLPTVPLTVGILLFLGLFNTFLGILSRNVMICFLLFFEWCFLSLLVLFAALGFVKLQRGAKSLTKGNLEEQITTDGLIGPLKVLAEDLNRIGEGLTVAVSEKIKSERLKTELISNVSHDIKTPLTSIINYTDLLSKEEGLSDQASEYLTVLQRQSLRLKKLTEDIVEASKASSGAITLEKSPCDLGVLLEQALAEYEEKLKEKQLSLCLTKPESPIIVTADGRRLWRIFDNLINNICKYALEGTRVYLDLTAVEGRAQITFRNISKEALRMNGEELTERFVRGDRSRNTEGSGLGLSIAKSLTEIQDGTFEIQCDGDLFKVTIAFPFVS